MNFEVVRIFNLLNDTSDTTCYYERIEDFLG